MMRFDHIAVTARSLEEGLAYVKDALGIDMPPGGAHPQMGTHNHLISLGPTSYLEVIAIDPMASPPSSARWYGLDAFDAEPRIGTWVLATPDLDKALEEAPVDCGSAVSVSRGSLSWRLSVPSDGSMPLDGAFPTLIEWEAYPHPASTMTDLGLRLRQFTIAHPKADLIEEFVSKQLGGLAPFMFNQSDRVSFEASFDTPSGVRLLP